MEKLNEYLQSLLSTCSYELHLEPNKNPYLVASGGNIEVSNTPLLGSQISMMVFPLIPAAVKHQLPNQPEIEFVHPHNLGDFNFLVKKSPAGFIVSVRPILGDKKKENHPEILEPELTPSPNISFPDSVIENPPLPPNFEHPYLETNNSYSSSNIEIVAENFPVNAQPKDYPEPQFPKVETVSVNDPGFMTVFSDTSNYEPPIKKSEFAPAPVLDKMTSYHNGGQPGEPDQPDLPPQNLQPPAPPVPTFSASEDSGKSMKARLDALFQKMAEVGASDLHLSVSLPPMVRKDGKMQTLECGEGVLTPETMKQLLLSIMPEKNRQEFEERHDTDFAYEIEDLARFRANIFLDRKGMGGVFRIIPSKILTAEQLNLSEAILNLCQLSKGLVVVTGPTGSGKSTTLCAMMDYINQRREEHIITIEDPIEFVHDNKRCLVNQREVHNHTDSFKNALRAALREDPDILLVGEMRDLETISIAIETAETGHLVFGTLHTTTAASTVDRIIDQFPADRQQQIRVMLSESLKGVIAQTLLPKKGGGRIAALEVLIVTPAISNLIREGKTFQIPSAMQTGKSQGMVMLNDALIKLVKDGQVDARSAYIKAVDKTGFESLLQREGIKMY